MRRAGTCTNRDDADRLSDYLLTLDIAAQVEPAEDEWAVWIKEERHVGRAKEEIERFHSNPADPRYDSARKAARDLRNESARRAKRTRALQVDIRQTWGRPGLLRRPFTVLLAFLCAVLAVVTRFGNLENVVTPWLTISSYTIEGDIIHYPDLSDVASGQVWRLITPIFLHFSLLHLVFNVIFLFQIGGLIETRRGTWRFAAMVLAIAAVSNLAQYAMSGPQFGGISGVDYGLFGYAWMKGRYDPESRIGLHPQTILIMLAWLFFCLTGFMPIANTAHFSGLAMGIAMGLARPLWRRFRGVSQ